MAAKPHWAGVFPAITTQLRRDQSLDLEGTARHLEALLDAGVAGIIVLGSLGENQTLTPPEKRQVLDLAVRIVHGRVPVLSGVAETSCALAAEYVRDGEKLGADGFMVMPAMCYRGDEEEILAHFRTVPAATGLPLMAYNNPLSYANDLTPELFCRLGEIKTYVALKESSGDVRRITDLHNTVGDRFALFTGIDNLLLESAILGIDGWVAGSGIAFPTENQRLWDLTRAGKWDAARDLYRWFAPLLGLDVGPKFVQYIKLATQETGLGKEWVRAPRQTLKGDERKQVLKIIRKSITDRPKLRG